MTSQPPSRITDLPGCGELFTAKMISSLRIAATRRKYPGVNKGRSTHCHGSPRETARRASLLRGFTLIELLAAVAIIGILAILLVPLTSKMKDHGLKTQCLGNLRAIGGLIPMYTQEHDGLLPGPSPNGLPATYEKGNINDPRSLAHFFIPYVDPNIQSGERKIMKIFTCPAALRKLQPQELSDPKCYGKSGTRKNGVEILPSPFGGRSGTVIASMPVKIQSLENLSQIISVFDRADPSDIVPGTAHGSSRNILFLDGHVRNVPLSKIVSATEVLD